MYGYGEELCTKLKKNFTSKAPLMLSCPMYTVKQALGFLIWSVQWTCLWQDKTKYFKVTSIKINYIYLINGLVLEPTN